MRPVRPQRLLRRLAIATGCAALAAPLAAPAALAQRQIKEDTRPQTEVLRCSRRLGTIAIAPPENQWWRYYSLGSPENLIRSIVARSGCFGVVNRAQGLAMRETERAMGAELQRGSNVGAGQVRAADFFLVPDVVGADRNAGGNAVGAGLGGLVGGAVGGVLGGVRTRRMDAHVVLTVVNARTTEELHTAEGRARKTDVGFGGGGFLGFAGAVGGGYEDTDIGKLITQAYIYAYNDIVRQMGGGEAVAQSLAETPRKAFQVIRATPMLNQPGGRAMKQLSPGDTVYPLGPRQGVFVKVADEFDIEGWVTTEAIRG